MKVQVAREMSMTQVYPLPTDNARGVSAAGIRGRGPDAGNLGRARAPLTRPLTSESEPFSHA